MKNTSLLRRVLSVVLTVALLCTLLVPAASAVKGEEKTVEELTLTPIDPGTLESQKLGKTEEGSSIEQEAHALTEMVRVSIVLEKPSTLGAGFSANGIADNAAAVAYREGLRADQKALTAKIEQAIGTKLDVQWNLTLAANNISANVLYGQIDTIKAVPGVKDVFLENRYEPEKGENGDEPNNGAASYMIGSNLAWANGYTGAGSKVAIIDTGADSEHQSFSGEGLEYALAQNAEEKGMTYDEYVATLNLLTPEAIDAVKDQLNANIGSGSAAYRNTKIGYGYNYVDKVVNYIEHINDSQGEHGSHVSGIATGNRFIKVDGEFVPALSAVGTQGVAPDAQLVVMKVFGKGGGAYDSDYMVAIEDAIILGCDSANLSLGSGAAGFSFSGNYESVMNELVENGLVVAISAGNSYGWYDTPYNEEMYPYLYAEDVNYDTNGSPGSFTNSLTVASVDNLGQTGMPLIFGDLHVFYSETDYQQDKIATLAGQDLEYVYFDNTGVDGNDVDLLAPYADVIAGKVVLCSRGDSSFYQKVNAAAAAGAVACVIYNNQAGVINMNLTGITTKIPAVSILQADGLAIKAQSEAVTADDGTVYYTGSMSVGAELEIQVPEITDTVTVSSFSSWGTPGTMVLKPEILAPGGSIYSVNGLNNGGGGHDQYEVMSGTSMASPQVAGMAAVMGQYIRDNELCEKTGLSARQLTNSLLMSTAHPVFNSNGSYWPVIRVGAGLGNVADATAAQSYILMDEEATMFPDSAMDGKVKAELGDDPDYTGEYEYSFTVYPLEDAKEFTLRTDIFTQWLAGSGGYGMLQSQNTMLLAHETTYEINGETYGEVYQLEADVNMDGATDEADAQAILDHITGEEAEGAAFDAEAADVDGDGAITSYDAKLILDAAGSEAIAITEPTKVTVHIKLDEEDRDFMLYYCPNGFYVEGYTYVEPVATKEGAMDVVHSIPIYGFCGNWTDPSMLDRTTVIDEAYGTGKLPYLANTNTNYLTMKDAEGDTSTYMGNPYAIEDVFPAERLAMNSESTIQAYNYINIRNAATLGFAVRGEDGKVLYAQATPMNQYAPYYYVNGGAWQQYSPRNYNVGKKLSVANVAEGDKVSVGFYVLPEYYGVMNAKMNGEVATSGGLDSEGFKAMLEADMIGEGAGLKYDVTIDNTAPVVVGALQDLISGDIYVKCSDNFYVAYVAVTNKSGSQVFFGTVPEQNGPGEEIEVPLDLEGVNLPNEVVLLVADYAGNEATFVVNLGGNGGGEDPYAGLMLGFVPADSTAAPGEGNRIWEIDKDALWYDYSAGTYEGLNVFGKTNFTVRAAEYVDGYVFMACTDGWFRVAELAAMDEAMMVGQYEPEVIYDMAFNYRNNTMYVLDNTNTVYSMDLLTGALTPVVHLSLEGLTNGVANRLAIDDNGTFYTASYGGPSSAYLFKFKLPEPVEEEEDPASELGEKVYGFGFETDVAEEGWQLLDVDGDGKNWELSTDYAKEGTKSLKSVSYESGTAYNPDNWAVSPAIDLSAYEEATLSVWLMNYMTSFPETFALYAGTTDNVEEMTKLGSDIIPGASWEQYTADISDFAGEEAVYVAIRHYNSYDEFRGYADLVEVYGKLPEEPIEEPSEILEISASNVGNIGAWNYSYGGAFAWDHNEDVLYLASNYSANRDYDHYLWVINTSTGKAARANETQGTALDSSNTSARLYGCVNGLIIVPTEESIIEPAEEPIDLIVEPEELNIFVGQSADVTVGVLPWTLVNKDVTFAIADEGIATVNDKGTVTGVAVGTTTLTVTTVAEPQLTAEVTVNVTVPPEAELRGIIWDENGKGQASVFNTNDTANWEALSVVGQLRWGSLVDDRVYGSTEDTMFVFDADTYEVTQLGGIVSDWIPSDADALPADMAEAYGALVSSGHVGRVIGICMNGTYLEMLDPELGSLVYFDLSDDFASDPMALLSFAGRTDYEGEEDCAVYLMMTESGKLYAFILTMDGSLYMEEMAQTAMDLTGVADVTNSTWASMYYDDENEFIYIAKYTDGDDVAYMYAIDANDPACMGVTGDFNDSVWPVVGLYKYEPATDLAMSVDPTDLVLYVGDTAEINIKIKLGETNEYEAEIADPAICSFEDGIVTGLKEGETDITITTVDTNEAGEHLTETVHVTVKDVVALDLIVKGQVSDAKGDRFTNIMLDGPTAASSGKPAPTALTSGGRGGDLYLGEKNGTAYVLNAETFEPDNSYTVDPYFSTYPPMDVANYPMFVDSTGAQDASKFLFTTNLGWLVKPDYYGWNLSSYIPDMAAVAFAGTSVNDEDADVYVYYILTMAGALYEIEIEYEEGTISLAQMLDTGITVSDQSALSMAYVYDANIHGDFDVEEMYGLVVANNEDQGLWFIDFAEEDSANVVKKIGTLDSENVTGLMGSFDDLAYVGEEPTPPQPDVGGDLIEGYYFESEDEFNEWTLVDADGDGYNWTWNYNASSWFDGTPDFSTWAYEGTGCAATASFINTVGVLSPDNWMVSGPIDLSDAADDAIVSLYAKGLDPSYAAEKFAIYAGTSDDVDTMTQIGGVFVSSGEYKQYYASLADFVGEDEVYIAIRHWDISDMYILLVDAVEVLDNLTTDIPEPEPEPEPIGGDVAYSWDFEADPTSDGWTFVDSDNDGYNWYWHVNTGTGNYTTHSGDGIIASDSYNNDTGAVLYPDNWAVSPALDLSEAASAGLSLWAVGQDASYAAEKFQLYAGTSADVTEMQAVSSLFTATGSYVNYTADLSAFAGEEEVYVAIRHYNVSDMFILNIDDVEILVTAPEDGDSLKNVPAKSYEAVEPAFNANVLGDGFAKADASKTYVFSASAEMQKFGEETQAVGGTNAIQAELVKSGLRQPIDETTVADGNVQIVLTEDEAVTNGVFTVTYNADVLTYVDTLSSLPFKSIHHEICEPDEDEPDLRTGMITFAYASKDEIPAEEVLATLNFTYEAPIDTTVVVASVERNEDFDLDESLVIEIKDGEVPEDQIFELVDVLKDGDQVIVVNSSYNKALSNEVANNYYLAGKDVEPVDEKIVNPEEDIIWTVVYGEDGVSFADADGNKVALVIDGRYTNLKLEGEDNVWALEAVEGADRTYFVRNTTAKYNDKDQYLEWYASKNYFSGYGMQADTSLYTFQFYAKTEAEPVHDCQITHFEDVMEAYPDPESPEHKAIEWAYVNGYTAGIDETHFGVGKSLTRAETATFFWTISGKPEISEDMFENPFSDVKPGKWYTKYVLWAFSEGLVSGYEDGTYRPQNELNRGEILTLLYAYADKPSIEGLENPYSDVAPGKWYEAPAVWAYHNGIECGEDGVFARSTVVNRETFVLYLYRYFEKDCLATP